MHSGFAPVSKGVQAYPRCRVPAAPLAGALLIGISAVPVSCCAHLSAPDVWQLPVLGAAASITLSRRECAPAVVLVANRRSRTVKEPGRWPARWLVTHRKPLRS